MSQVRNRLLRRTEGRKEVVTTEVCGNARKEGNQTGLFPGEETGLFPGEETGLFPGEETGLFPGEETGLSPGDEKGGVCPGAKVGVSSWTKGRVPGGKGGGVFPGAGAGDSTLGSVSGFLDRGEDSGVSGEESVVMSDGGAEGGGDNEGVWCCTGLPKGGKSNRAVPGGRGGGVPGGRGGGVDVGSGGGYGLAGNGFGLIGRTLERSNLQRMIKLEHCICNRIERCT